jgi:2-dehydro-3-deoxygalactonokinase
MKLFFSCDWGTSMFRLRLVDAVNAGILSEIKTGYGIGTAFESWKQNERDQNNRVAFYQTYLFDQVKKIVTTFKGSAGNAPIVISGMASSSIGMLQLPYKKAPFRCDGLDLVIHTIPAKQGMPLQIIISGVQTEADVIRGEETILAGCDIESDDKEQLFILPGTHSKHISVKDGWAKDVTTYMTGELFDLLSNKSILSASVKKDTGEQSIGDRFFAEGVQKGITINLMNSIFHVRTNQLFGKASPEENYHYLSGLLIGHELKALTGNREITATLVCGTALKKAYMSALGILKLNNQCQYKDADQALINGQRKIMDRISGN